MGGGFAMPPIQTRSGNQWFADHRDRTAHFPVSILIHGAGGTHLDWPSELRRMPEANGIVPDLPGHGRSGVQLRQSAGAYAADMIALLDALKLEQVVCIGHSMGGAVALMLALHYPARVLGLVLIGSSAKLSVNPALLEGLATDYPAAVQQLVSWQYSPVSAMEQRRAVQRLGALSPTLLAADFAACSQFDVRTQIGQIQQPALVVAGDEDRMTPFRFSGEGLRDQLPKATLAKIAGGSHMMMIEQPEVVAAPVQRWLAEARWSST
jgi:pimeloyl-ACP methyl ester carboxylesterase